MPEFSRRYKENHEIVRITNVATETRSGYNPNKCLKLYPLQTNHWVFGVTAHEKEISKDV
jgi:hypothetical protein